MNRRPSLRYTLLVVLLSAILLVWLAVIALIYWSAWHEVDEVFDANLARSARVLTALLSHEAEEEKEHDQHLQRVLAELGQEGLRSYPRLAAVLEEYEANAGKEYLEMADAASVAVHRYESNLALLARYADGSVMLSSPGAPLFPMLHTGYFNFQGKNQWRGFSLVDESTGFLVQVGEKVEIRRELVDLIARSALTPALLALPLLGLLIWLGIGRGLRPLAHVATEVERRDPDSLEPVPNASIPREILPLVSALNGLFKRVDSALENERRFTADAAHELRTPLAAIRARVEVTRRKVKDVNNRLGLDQVLRRIDHLSHLVEQLLILARADARRHQQVTGLQANLSLIAVEELSEFGQMALDKQIELGLEAPDSQVVRGDAAALGILLRNLVDNALRYTGVGGDVLVRVGKRKNRAYLAVIDNGPGILPDARRRLFDRFRRGAEMKESGCGLGLSIVQRIAELHGAKIKLGEGSGGQGLRVMVLFPANASVVGDGQPGAASSKVGRISEA